MTRDLPAAFDRETVATVAAEYDRDADALAALVARAQSYLAGFPGIEDLIYEWKRTFAYDPVVARDETRYIVVLLPHVWTELADQLDISAGELDALRAVHDRQSRADFEVRAEDPSVFEGGEPMVLVRE